MPAIHPARLKIQVSELAAYYDAPNEFLRELRSLLEFYADRTRRPGQSGKPQPLIQAYQVPKQVLRRLENELKSQISADPDPAISLADALWGDGWYETRMLAVYILGNLPTEDLTVLIERLQDWGKSCQEDVLLDALLETGTLQLASDSLDTYATLLENWLEMPDSNLRKMGLRGLPGLIRNPEFANLPLVYRLLTPYVQEVSSSLETDLLTAIRALAKRSPNETAYYLQQNLQASHRSGTAWITRQSLDEFPREVQESLRETLREEMRSRSNGS
jgi:hypothetical protein